MLPHHMMASRGMISNSDHVMCIVVRIRLDSEVVHVDSKFNDGNIFNDSLP